MPTPKSKRTIVQQSSNHDSGAGSTTEEFSLGASSVVGETSRTIVVVNTNDRGPGSLRNAVDPSQDEPTTYFHGSNGVLTVAQITFSGAGEQDILSGGVYSDPSPDSIIDTGNGRDSITTSIDPGIGTNFITGGNGRDSITPFIDQGLGTNFITGGNGNDSITTFRDEGMGLNFITPDNGNDVFFATTRDRLIGTLGNDRITYAMVEGTTRDRLIGTFGSNDVFSATTRDRLIGTLGGNDTITYEMAEPTTRARLTDTPSGNGSSGSDGADTLLASYFGGNGSSGSDGADTLRASYFGGNGSSESGDSVDTLLGGYSEPSRKTEQFHGFPGLSISGNNTSRVTSTGDGYSDDNNSLESDYRATLYGGTGEDLFNGRSDTSSPLPLPATNQSPGLTDTITDQLFSSQTGTSAGTYLPVGAETVDSWSSSDFYSAMVEGRARDSLIDMLGDQGFFGSDGTSTLYGGMNGSLNGNNQTLIIEPPTDQLFPSGVSSVETTFISISGNNTSFAVLLDSANTNAAAKNDGAWRARGSTFETDSFGTPASFAGDLTISGNNSSQVIL